MWELGSFLKMLKEKELGYIAGIIDGEGTIHINRSKGRNGEVNYLYDLIVAVSNCDKRMIDYLFYKFKGSVSKDKRPFRRTCFRWLICSKQAEIFLAIIYPYLICKKEEVDIAMEFRDTYTKYHKKQTPKKIIKIR